MELFAFTQTQVTAASALIAGLSFVLTLVNMSNQGRIRELEQMYEVTLTVFDFRDALERVFRLDGKPYDTWDSADMDAAHTICSRFHLVGIQIHQKLFPEKIFAQAWYYAVPTTFRILAPYLAEMRRNRDYRYWSGFDYLKICVEKKTRNFRGFGNFPKPSGTTLRSRFRPLAPSRTTEAAPGRGSRPSGADG